MKKERKQESLEEFIFQFTEDAKKVGGVRPFRLGLDFNFPIAEYLSKQKRGKYVKMCKALKFALKEEGVF